MMSPTVPGGALLVLFSAAFVRPEYRWEVAVSNALFPRPGALAKSLLQMSAPGAPPSPSIFSETAQGDTFIFPVRDFGRVIRRGIRAKASARFTLRS